jgi:fatty acid-binding protein DegV
VQQAHDLFLSKLVLDYDYVFCICTTCSRSGIFDNAQQASFTILNDHKPVRAAADNNTPFALRVIDRQNVFAAVGVMAIEAARLGTGLMTPTMGLSFGGELEQMRSLTGYKRLRETCADHNVEVFESVMGLSGMVNVGQDSLVVGFAAEPAKFE